MADKYWCKHCLAYVTDTKLEKAKHEATGRHQSAVRRALRNLHREHERNEREKEKAKREVARLNSLVGEGASGASFTTATASRPRPPPPPPQPQPQNIAPSAGGPPREQLEQLAELGVNIPDEFRPELAMAGDWTVTETRIVSVEDEEGKKVGQGATRSVGVRKRPRGDREDDGGQGQQGHSEFEKIDLDAAVQGLFKKPRQWGRDSRTAGGKSGGTGDAGDLDSLLNSALAKPTKKEADTTETEMTSAPKEESTENIKKEDGVAETPAEAAPQAPKIKQEADGSGLDLVAAPDAAADADEKPAAADTGIVFKKRKTKTVRQR